MARSRRSALLSLAAGTASAAVLTGSLGSHRPRTFDRLSVRVESEGSLWFGALGFHDEVADARWEDVFGIGDREYVAPGDFEVHLDVTELYAPIEFRATPMAGFDPDDPLRATLSADGKTLTSGAVADEEDVVVLTFE